MSGGPLERVKERLNKKATAVAAFLSNPVGRDLLEILEEEYLNGELFVPGDAHRTAFNLGGREVVVYLKQLQKLKGNLEYVEK